MSGCINYHECPEFGPVCTCCLNGLCVCPPARLQNIRDMMDCEVCDINAGRGLGPCKEHGGNLEVGRRAD